MGGCPVTTVRGQLEFTRTMNRLTRSVLVATNLRVDGGTLLPLAPHGRDRCARRPAPERADTAGMTLGVSGYAPPRPIPPTPRHTAPMTIGVGVISGRRGALVTDSRYVDLATGAVRTRTKIVRENGRIAALAGLADFDGVDFFDALRAALRSSRTLEAIPTQFLHAASSTLADAYARLRHAHGIKPEDYPTEIVVIGTRNGAVQMGEFWTKVVSSSITMEGNIHEVRSNRAVCCAIGVHHPILDRTETAAIGLANTSHRPLQRPTSLRSTRDLARALAAEVITAAPHLPPPPGWPPGVLPVAEPLHDDAVQVSYLAHVAAAAFPRRRT